MITRYRKNKYLISSNGLKKLSFSLSLSLSISLSLYNLILLTGWIEISGVTSWYETTGRP